MQDAPRRFGTEYPSASRLSDRSDLGLLDAIIVVRLGDKSGDEAKGGSWDDLAILECRVSR